MEFSFDNDRPIYMQLINQMEKHIIAGTILPGDRLPSVRELAAMSQVNPNTVQKALGELENLGLIYTERTNGKFVTKDADLIKKRGEIYARDCALAYLNEMSKLGFTSDAAIDYLNKLEK